MQAVMEHKRCVPFLRYNGEHRWARVALCLHAAPCGAPAAAPATWRCGTSMADHHVSHRGSVATAPLRQPRAAVQQRRPGAQLSVEPGVDPAALEHGGG